jgi:hypothetical protein
MAYVVELTAPRMVGIREYPTPEPGVAEVRVRTLYSGISAGTELAIYRGTNPYLEKQWDAEAALFLPGQSTFHYPVDVWGYSEVGEVDAGLIALMRCCRLRTSAAMYYRRGWIRLWVRSIGSAPSP